LAAIAWHQYSSPLNFIKNFSPSTVTDGFPELQVTIFLKVVCKCNLLNNLVCPAKFISCGQDGISSRLKKTFEKEFSQQLSFDKRIYTAMLLLNNEQDLERSVAREESIVIVQPGT
jgi:hypothetical protein